MITRDDYIYAKRVLESRKDYSDLEIVLAIRDFDKWKYLSPDKNHKEYLDEIRLELKQDPLPHGEPLDYWKENAEEDYMKVPISVLKYITILEELNQR